MHWSLRVVYKRSKGIHDIQIVGSLKKQKIQGFKVESVIMGSGRIHKRKAENPLKIRLSAIKEKSARRDSNTKTKKQIITGCDVAIKK